MIKIPFKVSARTAKLIGRENFSNAEGAIIELVKNCYDANATKCIVVFDIPFEDIPKTLLPADYTKFSIENSIIKSTYQLKGEVYVLNQILDEKAVKLREFFFSKSSIYIIDNGIGMDEKIIKNHWMEIGTGNKEVNYRVGKRIKTGAKGIGRFALDRLGRLSEIYTVPQGMDAKAGYHWKMDWSQFDQPNQEMTNITAELEFRDSNLFGFLTQHLQGHPSLLKIINNSTKGHGTIVKITHVKDVWDEASLIGVNKSLEALIPPKDSAVGFDVNFYHVQKPKSFGEVTTAYFNDFDYKIVGQYDADELSVKLTITRNELDLKKVKQEFSHLYTKSVKPYDLNTLIKKTFTVTHRVHELLNWMPDVNNKTAIKNVGSFSFTFYYIKNRNSAKEQYPYKEFNSSERNAILDKFGGIKIYRDSFRVRPYGENGNDWLNLGERAASSPAGAGQRIGDWRVGPHQVAGSIDISRITNSFIVDKSDRGGLVENETFEIFKNIVQGVIGAFEYDRSKILNVFYVDNKKKEEREREEKLKKEARDLAKRMLEQQSKTKRGRSAKKAGSQKAVQTVYRKMIYESFEKLDRKEEEDAEIAQVRSLASLGLVVASFAHELKEIRNNDDNIRDLEENFKSLVPEVKTSSDLYNESMDIFESLENDFRKIVHWIKYALTAIKSDKRKRNSLKFDTYFNDLAKNWQAALIDRNIVLNCKANIRKAYDFRAFEVDMDTIFSNLISNSIDAFKNLKVSRERKINITSRLADQAIQIVYEDTGSGLADIFQKDREQIFLPFVTSKKDEKGNNLGTGLGMYLVKQVVDEYEGRVQLLDTSIGFALQIDLPIRKKK